MLKILSTLKTHSEDIVSLLKDHAVENCTEKSSLITQISRNTYDLILLEEDIEYISEIKSADPRVEVILFGNNGLDTLEAIKKGATAYFSLPLYELDYFRETVANIWDHIQTRIKTAELERELCAKYTFAGVVSKNPVMLEIFSFIRRIAPYYKTATIMGDTGTGKEVIAKAIYSLSPGAKHPFIACNCGALDKNLAESELFGHKKGSFTGAIADKPGLFSSAGEGVIFLDEIGELPLNVQPHLLRVLQDGEFRPVGSNRTLKSSCRVIAATNRDLSAEVKTGSFREDLFYRLTPLTITLPPLRERKDDIQLLCRYFLDKFTHRTGKKVLGISRPAQAALFSYDWPGNVRKLENVIEQAAILTTESYIRLEDLPEYLQEPFDKTVSSPLSLDDIEAKYIQEVLKECSGNKSKAADVLKISRRALLRKIQKYSSNC